MEWTHKMGMAVLLFAFLLLGTIVVFQFVENRSMRQVLIRHTMERINEQLDAAREAEREHLAALGDELDSILNGLTEASGLTGEQRALVVRGTALTGEIRGLTRSVGLEY